MLRPVAVLCTLVGFAALAPATDAAVRLKKGTLIVDNGLTLSVSGALTGLGNADVTITVIAEGGGSTVLVNPALQFVPGQNRVPLVLAGSETISATEIKNGNLSFSVTTLAPEDPDPVSVGAPNPNWDAFFTDIEFFSATIIVEQNGKVVFKTTISAD